MGESRLNGIGLTTRATLLTAVAVGAVCAIGAAPVLASAHESVGGSGGRLARETVSNSPAHPRADRSALADSSVLVGYSRKGIAIYARRQGNPEAKKTLLVIGSMHGNERKGIAVARGVHEAAIPGNAEVQVWTITTMNPDGTAANRRTNAHNVDLNRNFPTGWSRKAPNSGSRPASEVETRNMISFISKIRPDAVLSFHQSANTVFSICNKRSARWVRRTGRLMELPVPARMNCKADARTYRGTMNDWYTAHFPGVFATVELPANRAVTASKVKLCVSATLRLSKELAEARV